MKFASGKFFHTELEGVTVAFLSIMFLARYGKYPVLLATHTSVDRY